MFRFTATILLCVPALSAAAGVTAHEVLSFDYGWRFHLGPVGGSPPSPAPPGPPAPKPGCEDLKKAFPVDAGGYEFMGLTHGSGNSAQACATTCCDMGKGCYMWQFSSGPGGGCWVGSGTRGNKNGNWTGGARAGPAPPPSPKPTPHPGDGPDVLPASSPAAVPSFDDSSWQLIDLPHDYIVEGAYDQNVPGDQGPGSSPGGAGQSYLPRYLGFYRKHFTLPSDWKGKVIWIYFEGVFRSAKFWFNGQAVREHSPFAGDAHGEGGGVGMGGGYTSFSVRLDNATTVHYGTDQENVLSVYVDPRMGSGWFYEGGGIYRKTFLHSAPAVHIETDGVFARSMVSPSSIQPREFHAQGATASAASVTAGATVVNTGSTAATTSLAFALYNADGQPVGSSVSADVSVAAAANSSSPATATSKTVSIDVPAPELWSVARPYVYTLVVTSSEGDVYNTTLGIYSTKWTGDHGFFLNNEHVKIRGFCNHESFGGVGMAIPDRINLFRAQALRSVGGNGWRMSHNPVTPGLLDVLDRVGVVAMDESRELHSDPISVMNMGAMVKRDRNHPSIVIWSYCNEGGCGADGAWEFRNITLKYDPTRPTLGNAPNAGMDVATDVEGFSHSPGTAFDAFNAKNPSRPKFASECCSCESNRAAQSTAPDFQLIKTSASESCTATQSNESNARDFMAGTMVWTLFDYYGESHGWPRVSSAYGQYDLAGFRKFTAWWYHTFWLSAVPMADAGRPVGFGAAPTCYPYESGGTVNVLTEAAQVELWIDGNKTATANPDPLTAASLPKGTGGHNITAVCLDASGKVTSTNTILSAGTATALQLSLDAPSEKFGSGTHLLLDGHDVAMVRATVVDASGVKVESSTANISFAVASGPGRVLATHNGDNTCHEPNHASWHSAFVGLARAIVQVTEHRIGTPEQRARLAEIDRESAHTRVVGGTLGPSGSSSIVVVASSPGLASATVEIPVSTEEQHSVLAAASRSLAQEQLWTM